MRGGWRRARGDFNGGGGAKIEIAAHCARLFPPIDI